MVGSMALRAVCILDCDRWAMGSRGEGVCLIKGNNMVRFVFGEDRSGHLLEKKAQRQRPMERLLQVLSGNRQVVHDKRFLLTCSPKIQKRG